MLKRPRVGFIRGVSQAWSPFGYVSEFLTIAETGLIITGNREKLDHLPITRGVYNYFSENDHICRGSLIEYGEDQLNFSVCSHDYIPHNVDKRFFIINYMRDSCQMCGCKLIRDDRRWLLRCPNGECSGTVAACISVGLRLAQMRIPYEDVLDTVAENELITMSDLIYAKRKELNNKYLGIPTNHLPPAAQRDFETHQQLTEMQRNASAYLPQHIVSFGIPGLMDLKSGTVVSNMIKQSGVQIPTFFDNLNKYANQLPKNVSDRINQFVQDEQRKTRMEEIFERTQADLSGSYV